MSALEYKFTSEYFRDEVVRLRELWGTKSFWSNKDKPRIALGAIFYTYLNSPPSESAKTLWESTVMECERREQYVVLGI